MGVALSLLSPNFASVKCATTPGLWFTSVYAPAEFRKEFDLQHALEVADTGCAASAPLEADDALDRRDVVETPASEMHL